jgi:thioredoxin-like negative regulator of GroEL
MQDGKAMIRCFSCGTVNRVSPEKLTDILHCGNCHQVLDFPRSAVSATELDFEKEVLSWPGPVLVEFWNHGCVFCEQIGPLLEAIAREKAGLLKVVTMNTAYSPSLASRLGVQGVPTLFLYNNGAPLARTAGALPKEKLSEWIRSNTGV